MVYLQHVGVVASVRIDGAIGKFERRTFDFMLDQRDPQNKQLREARRILVQLGYEVRGLSFEMNPGN